MRGEILRIIDVIHDAQMGIRHNTGFLLLSTTLAVIVSGIQQENECKHVKHGHSVISRQHNSFCVLSHTWQLAFFVLCLFFKLFRVAGVWPVRAQMFIFLVLSYSFCIVYQTSVVLSILRQVFQTLQGRSFLILIWPCGRGSDLPLFWIDSLDLTF